MSGRYCHSKHFLLKLCCTAIVLIQAYSLHALQTTPPSSVQSLNQFFEEIIQAEHFSLPPENTSLNEVEKQIPSAAPDQISNALSSIFLALSSRTEEVRWCAISALMIISERPDSTELLKGYIGRIADLWQASDKKLQAAPAAILKNTDLNAYPGVLPLMLQFIKRKNRAIEAQSSTLYVLAKHQPADPTTIEAAQEFLARPLDVPTRINTINGLSLAHMNDSQTRRAIIEALFDGHSEVKLAAISAITRMGEDALNEATPRLSELAKSSEEPSEVKSAALKALNKIRR